MKRERLPISVELPSDLMEKFEDLCIREGVSVDDYLNDLVLYEIAKKRALGIIGKKKS